MFQRGKGHCGCKKSVDAAHHFAQHKKGQHSTKSLLSRFKAVKSCVKTMCGLAKFSFACWEIKLIDYF